MNKSNLYYGQYITENEWDSINSRIEESIGKSKEHTVGGQGLNSVDTVPEENPGTPNMHVFIPAGSGWGTELQSVDGGSDNLTVVVPVMWDSQQDINCQFDKDSVSTVPSAGNKRYIGVFAKYKRALSGDRTDLDGNPLKYNHFDDFETEVWAGAEGGSPSKVSVPTGYILLFDVLLNENCVATGISEPSDWYSPGENELDITRATYLAPDEIKNARGTFHNLKERLDGMPNWDGPSNNDLTVEKLSGDDIDIHEGTFEYIKCTKTGQRKLILGDDTPNNDVKVEVAGDLTVLGTETIINSEEVNIGENRIVINTGITDDSQNSDASYEVKRLDDETGTGREVDSLYVPTHGTYPKKIILNTGHGIVAGDYVEITGATNSSNDKTYKIASVNVNELEYDDAYSEVAVNEVTTPAKCAKLVNSMLRWDESAGEWSMSQKQSGGDVELANFAPYMLPPMGSVIGIHPDVKTAYLPDSRYWSPCDGVANLPTARFETTHDTKVPDLTDDRFLMGGSAYGTGGNNDGHYHGKGDLNIAASGSHFHAQGLRSDSTISGAYQFGLSSYNGATYRHAVTNSTMGNNPKTSTETHTHTSGDFAGSVGATAGVDGDASGANRPKYFKAKYYIRIL
jgi:hypothetical protein